MYAASLYGVVDNTHVKNHVARDFQKYMQKYYIEVTAQGYAWNIRQNEGMQNIIVSNYINKGYDH